MNEYFKYSIALSKDQLTKGIKNQLSSLNVQVN